jgi:hypothetical protein
MAALAAVYRTIAPWILAAWILAALLPGPRGQQVLLILGASPFFAAATARALGLHRPWTTAALAVDRAFSHLASLAVLAVFFALAAALGATLGAWAADRLGLADDRALSMPLAALATLPILWRHWPAILLAYLVPEGFGSRVGGRAWRGPGYSEARQLARATARPGRTLLLLSFLLLWIALALAAGAAQEQLLVRALEAATYLVFIPVFFTLAATEILEMLARLDGPAVEGA